MQMPLKGASHHLSLFGRGLVRGGTGTSKLDDATKGVCVHPTKA